MVLSCSIFDAYFFAKNIMCLLWFVSSLVVFPVSMIIHTVLDEFLNEVFREMVLGITNR